MKVHIPKNAKYRLLIDSLKSIRSVTDDDTSWIVESTEDFALPREWSRLSPSRFRSLGKAVTVSGGTKKYDDETITFSTSRPKSIEVHVSDEEKEALVKAAKKTKTETAVFVREAAVARARKILSAEHGPSQPESEGASKV